ncbi:MAG: DUF1127 domain-containing protein [Rhodospirillales bacterium]|jgi:uncharacterized protein YjiS (DUF1127 family)|nr:DUF1127 domain-containing protein [Rhodospirillales bacterium]MBT4041312.1 DUF1127 domain-containing protein [Rhodospirillales bacterium]MBT4625739.1 DUF1127 domain-containing protein [Rhodospirillales bacterium]MBT5352720.1 DUF1127 domain-containing protein [Rhodospirillales bacterium]MBT5521633.1 DUF1127 domain-containing protein [Rhodospirillales bacterium]
MNTFYTPTFGRLRLRGGSFFTTLLRWSRIYRERQALRGLDDRLLRDIGVTRIDAAQEFSKRFWQE